MKMNFLQQIYRHALLVATLLLGSAFLATAQELTVKSFKLRDRDILASKRAVKDLNGNNCALLRVYIAAQNCIFKGDHIVGEPIAINGEYQISMAPGAKYLKISHKDYLFEPLFYVFEEPIESNKVYELRLGLPEESFRQNRTLKSQYVTMQVTPSTATVLVDNVMRSLQDGQLQLELPIGKHTYEVKAPQYYTEMSTFEVQSDHRTDLKINLKSSVGALTIQSSPAGATVMIGNEVKGQTPCTISLESGPTHLVQIMLEGYVTHEEQITVNREHLTKIDTKLQPHFAQITLQAFSPESEIWLNGKPLGTGSWTGRLDAGSYLVETYTEGYEPTHDSIDVTPDSERLITLSTPKARHGILKVTTLPFGAEIRLDGKVIGTTPYMSDKISLGSHELEVELKGYQTDKRSIFLTSDADCTIEIRLEKSESPSPKQKESQADKAAPSTPSRKVNWESPKTAASAGESTQMSTPQATQKMAAAKKQRPGYRVGSYYKTETKEGIVFWVDESGMHGKIVQLKDLGILHSWESAQRNSKTKPEWRIPTYGELELIFSHIDDINQALMNAYGEPFAKAFYWSSTYESLERVKIGYMGKGNRTTMMSGPRRNRLRLVTTF